MNIYILNARKHQKNEKLVTNPWKLTCILRKNVVL